MKRARTNARPKTPRVLQLKAPEGWRWADEFVTITYGEAFVSTAKAITCRANNLDKTILSIIRNPEVQKRLNIFYWNLEDARKEYEQLSEDYLIKDFDPSSLTEAARTSRGERQLSFTYWFCSYPLLNYTDLGKNLRKKHIPLLHITRRAVPANALSSLWDGIKIGSRKNPDDDFPISVETLKEGTRQVSQSKFLRPRKFGRSYSMRAFRDQLPELRESIRTRDAKRFGKAWIKTGLDGTSDVVFDGIISGAILIPGLAGAGLLGVGGAATGSAASPVGTGVGAVVGSAVGGIAGARAGYEAVKPMLRNPKKQADRPTPRRTVRSNPYGTPVQGVALVRVGKGTQVHLFDPKTGAHLCQSGKNAGSIGGSGVQPVSRPATDAHYVTCYRCGKLAQMNKVRYGGFLPPDR